MKVPGREEVCKEQQAGCWDGSGVMRGPRQGMRSKAEMEGQQIMNGFVSHGEVNRVHVWCKSLEGPEQAKSILLCVYT